MEEESAALPSLEPEIMLHIFQKLPMRAVHKCKLVCKEWLSLISEPFFKSNYKPCSIPNHPVNLIMIPTRHKNLSSLAYNEINTTTSTPRVARPQPLPWTFAARDRVQIIGCCNGLVALYRHPGQFCLFNPCAAPEDHIEVHVPMDEGECRLYHSVLYGLSYDSVHDEYKAVVCSLEFDVQSFYVVNFKNRSWKLKPQPQIQNLRSWREKHISGTIVENVPYWVCRDIALDCYLIFYFDSKTEELIEAPRVANGEEIWGLGTLDGLLTASLKSDAGLEVWGLKEHGNGEWCWSMLFVMKHKLFL